LRGGGASLIGAESANTSIGETRGGIESSRTRTWRVAYHEAAKAVARIHFGATPVVEVSSDDTAVTFEQWRPDSDDQQVAWHYVFVKMSGWRSEARALQLPFSQCAALRHARAYREAQKAVRWLVQNRHAADEQAAWERCQHEVGDFLSERWPEIERVARALLERGRLKAAEIVTLAQVRD
jgi:hypothetical protein